MQVQLCLHFCLYTLNSTWIDEKHCWERVLNFIGCVLQKCGISTKQWHQFASLPVNSVYSTYSAYKTTIPWLSSWILIVHCAWQFKSQQMLCSKSITVSDCDTNTAVQVIIILFTVHITCIYSTSTAIYYILIIFCSRYPENGVVIFFFWSAGKFLPKYMASHSRTRIFPRHQSEPQFSHSYYQFILHIYIISKLPPSLLS